MEEKSSALDSQLSGIEILLGVTGGIAAYKAADLTSRLVQLGAGVTVAMSPAAEEFIRPLTFEALTSRPVYSSQFDSRTHFQGEHIGLARRAAIYVVAPATADFIGKVANGLANDLLSTLAMTSTCPMVAAPAMNADMWAKAPVQRNVATLREDGWRIINPGDGWLSCGQVGPGRMAEPANIVQVIRDVLTERGG